TPCPRWSCALHSIRCQGRQELRGPDADEWAHLASASKEMTMPKGYSVHLAAAGPALDEDLLDQLADRLREIEGAGDVAAWGGIAGGPSVQMSVEADSVQAALAEGTAMFENALRDVGIDG